MQQSIGPTAWGTSTTMYVGHGFALLTVTRCFDIDFKWKQNCAFILLSTQFSHDSTLTIQPKGQNAVKLPQDQKRSQTKNLSCFSIEPQLYCVLAVLLDHTIHSLHYNFVAWAGVLESLVSTYYLLCCLTPCPPEQMDKESDSTAESRSRNSNRRSRNRRSRNSNPIAMCVAHKSTSCDPSCSTTRELSG